MSSKMDWSNYLTFTLLIMKSILLMVSGDCVFDLNQNISNEPLLLRLKNNQNSYELIRQQECKLRLKPSQTLQLACPGKANYLNYTKDSSNVATCKSVNKLEIKGSQTVYSSLLCNTRPHADLKVTDRKCFRNSGEQIQAGFRVEDAWHPVLEICHDMKKSHTYYVKHTLVIPTSSCVNTYITRPGFVEAGFYSDLNMAQIYKTEYQLSLFQQTIGSDNASYYIDPGENKYLARGHLAPDADFPLDAWKTVTYFYINTSPQWQSINGGNWNSLESKIRAVASKLTQLDVITGTHGFLKIGNKEIYLANKKVPVPEYFWKLIHNPDDNSCIGFITKNNPYLKRHPQHICQDVCSRYGWNVGNSKLSAGSTYCCEYHLMKRQIQEVPAVTCTRALRFTQ